MRARILLDGLHFPECPRWHDNRLWFSDMQVSTFRRRYSSSGIP